MQTLKKRPGKFSIILALIVVLVLLAGACGGGGDDDDDSDSGGSDVMSTVDGEYNVSGGDAGVEARPYEGGGVDAEEAEPAADEASAPTGSPPYDTSYVAQQLPLDRLIIRTVTLSLTVEDVAQGSIWLRDLAARKGGFVFSSNTYVRDESEFAQITIRVPADQLDSTVQELREHDLVVQVDSEESTSQDVSQEFVDNEARLEALEETQRRFLALLSEPDDVEGILRIESELTNIRSQIETIKGRQNYLEQMTAHSTVTVTMHGEDSAVETLEAEDDGFLARIFGDSWDSASGVIEDLLTGTLTIGIIALVALPIVLALYVIGRVLYRRVIVGYWSPRQPVVATNDESA